MITQIVLGFLGIPSGIALMRIFRVMLPSRPRISRRNLPNLYELYIPFIHLILVWSFWKGVQHSNMYISVFGTILGLRLSSVGLTGSIASGKSTASAYLRDNLGYVVIDADRIAREILDRDTSGYRAVIKTFGNSMVNPATGHIDRVALGAVVFADPKRRRALERITHPRIVSKMVAELIWYRLTGRSVVLDVPLLFESPNPLLRFLCHERVLVDVDYHVQKNRLMTRNPDLSEGQIEDRIRAQMSRAEKLKLADYVITNNGSIESFYTQLDVYFR